MSIKNNYEEIKNNYEVIKNNLDVIKNNSEGIKKQLFLNYLYFQYKRQKSSVNKKQSA